jgi:hypothetical protein
MSNPIVVSLQDIHKSIDANVEYQRDWWIKYGVQLKEKADNVFLAIQLLSGEGFDFGDMKFRHSGDFNHVSIEVKDMKEFVKVHRALGHLQNDGNEAATEDIRKPRMKIWLRPKDEKFSNIRFYYYKNLPGPNSKEKGKFKCRLKRVKETRVVLVCE